MSQRILIYVNALFIESFGLTTLEANEMGNVANVGAQKYDWIKIARMYIDAYSEAIHDAVKFLRLNPTKK